MEFKVELRQQGREVKAYITIRDGVKYRLRDKLSETNYHSLISRWGVRCDDYGYFIFSEQIDRVFNFDILYDLDNVEDRYSCIFDTEEQATQFIKDFTEWWENTGKRIIHKIEELANNLVVSSAVLSSDKPVSMNLPNPPKPPKLNIHAEKYLIVGNEIYTISARRKSNNPLKDIQKELEKQYEDKVRLLREQMKEYKEQIEEKMRKELEKYKSQPLIPEWFDKYTVFKTRAMLYKSNDNYIIFLIPYDYQPVLFKKDGVTYKILNPIDPVKVYIKITVYQDEVKSIRLLYRDIMDRFRHYHSLDDGDCVGNMPLPTIKSPDDFISFVERVGKGLMLINVDDIAEKYPDDLPHIDDYELKEVDVWTTES